ncbi:hypothetical protein R3P38DRAFT_2762961 [Favolaschia claudopus]|uniref:Uncharacterized protein n=1 Tax=Favolaschia claudopus TaxID=2862362 RepID=A0AAW0DNL7_9AGAR
MTDGPIIIWYRGRDVGFNANTYRLNPRSLFDPTEYSEGKKRRNMDVSESTSRRTEGLTYIDFGVNSGAAQSVGRRGKRRILHPAEDSGGLPENRVGFAQNKYIEAAIRLVAVSASSGRVGVERVRWRENRLTTYVDSKKPARGNEGIWRRLVSFGFVCGDGGKTAARIVVQFVQVQFPTGFTGVVIVRGSDAAQCMPASSTKSENLNETEEVDTFGKILDASLIRSISVTSPTNRVDRPRLLLNAPRTRRLMRRRHRDSIVLNLHPRSSLSTSLLATHRLRMQSATRKVKGSAIQARYSTRFDATADSTLFSVKKRRQCRPPPQLVSLSPPNARRGQLPRRVRDCMVARKRILSQRLRARFDATAELRDGVGLGTSALPPCGISAPIRSSADPPMADTLSTSVVRRSLSFTSAYCNSSAVIRCAAHPLPLPHIVRLTRIGNGNDKAYNALVLSSTTMYMDLKWLLRCRICVAAIQAVSKGE